MSAYTRSRSDRFIRSNSHRLGKQIDVPVLHTNRDFPGTLLLRFRCKIAVRETEYFLRLYLRVFTTTRTSSKETETPVVCLVAFSFRKMINGSFFTIDRKQSLRISVFDARPMYLFLSVFLNHLTCVVLPTFNRSVVLLAMLST